jgi:NAD-reducing hydrogenase large subunit
MNPTFSTGTSGHLLSPISWKEPALPKHRGEPACGKAICGALGTDEGLIHHYKIDENGLIKWVNMIIATGHNSLAMNQSVRQIAQHYVKGSRLQEGMLNRVEAVIRCYDPCLSCSTHAISRMPLHIQLLGPQGKVLDQAKRT